MPGIYGNISRKRERKIKKEIYTKRKKKFPRDYSFS